MEGSTSLHVRNIDLMFSENARSHACFVDVQRSAWEHDADVVVQDVDAPEALQASLDHAPRPVSA
jgi:hypothetical protein